MNESSYDLDCTAKNHLETLEGLKDYKVQIAHFFQESESELKGDESKSFVLDKIDKTEEEELINEVLERSLVNTIPVMGETKPKTKPFFKSDIFFLDTNKNETKKQPEEEEVVTTTEQFKTRQSKFKKKNDQLNLKKIKQEVEDSGNSDKIISFNKAKLERTKEFPTDKDFKHEVFLKGQFLVSDKSEEDNLEDINPAFKLMHHKKEKQARKELYIPLKDFNKEAYALDANLLNNNDKGKNLTESIKRGREMSLYEVCDFFAKLFKLSKLLLDQFKIFLKPVNMNTLCIFALFTNITSTDFSQLTNKEEYKISELIIKNITLDTLLSTIPTYIEFLFAKFLKPIEQNFTDNFIDQLIIDRDKLVNLKRFQIYSDVTNIINNFFGFFLLKRNCNSDDLLNNQQSKTHLTDLQSNYFYIILAKIEKYCKVFFPFCCGNLDPDGKHYLKSPYVFCFECKTLICINCFKNHKSHKYFDFANMCKYKDKNIHAPKEKFLRNKENKSVKREKENSFEDLILDTILNKFNSKVHSFFVEARDSNELLKSKQFFTVFDFMEIFLLEHLFKLVFPYMHESEFYDNKNEFLYMKKKLSEDQRFVKSIAHSIIKLNRKLNKGDEGVFNLKNLTLEDYYLTTVEEYIEQTTLKEYEEKYNRFIIEDLFFSKMSTELQVTKSLIMSNTDLNYEIPSSDFALMISQVNSPKQFYSNLFQAQKGKDKEVLKIDDGRKSTIFKKNNIGSPPLALDNNANATYNKFMVDFSEMVKCETTNAFTSSSKYNFSSKNKKDKKDIKKTEVIKKTVNLGKKLVRNATLNMGFQLALDVYDINEIMSSALNKEENFARMFSVDPDVLYVDSSNPNESTRIKFKDGYVSKYSLVCLYIEDLLIKICNYGSIKYKNE